MPQNDMSKFRGDYQEFREMTEKFYQKEINVAQYKGFSGRFGSYAQRGGAASMLRLRLAGGEISKEHLKFIVDSIASYQISLTHLTTCQSLQLHNLSKTQVCALAEEAFDHGIISLGGGGDYPRNVMCSPLSGVQKDEPFDVLPYARAAEDYLLGLLGKVKLPRKLKVAFSNSRDNMTHATFRDLGFVATPQGKFDVYSAGGLGREPRMGVLVAEGIEPAKILYYIKAMVDTFTTHGNYQNRGKARTRYMQETLGAEGYRDAYQEKLGQALAEGGLGLTLLANGALDGYPSLTASPKQGDGKTLEHPRAIPQIQDGLYAVSYHPIGGNPQPEFWKKLYDAILPMEGVTARISPEQDLYIINLSASEAEQILELTADGAESLFETSVSCIGASICQVGARDSQKLLHACMEAARKEGLTKALPQIHISGCPSSCSAHQAAALGFRGGVKQTPDGPKPAFAVFENGCGMQGQEAFGTDLGVITEEEIPSFLVELGREIASRNTDYRTFTETHRDEFLKIVEKYA